MKDTENKQPEPKDFGRTLGDFFCTALVACVISLLVALTIKVIIWMLF